MLFNLGKFADGGKIMILYPFFFFISYIILCPRISKSDYSFTLVSYCIVQWIRFVMLPTLVALSSNGFQNVPFISDSAWLMLYEFLVTSLFMFIVPFRRFERADDQLLELKGSKYVYYFLALVALGLFILFLSRGTRLLNFLIIKVQSGGVRIGDFTETGMVFINQLIVCTISYLFMTCVTSLFEKYQRTAKRIYVYISILLAMLVVSVIVGERRSAQIYSSICVCYILTRLYKQHSKKILKWVLGTAGFVLLLMSVYKFSYAFLYDSYYDAIKQSSFSIDWLADMIQSYFGGPRNTSLAIDFANRNSVGIDNLLLDFVRSTAPFSFLVKKYGVVTSVLFNRYMYGGLQDTGHVLNATAYGYIYGGFLLCPWVMILNLSIAMFFERKLKTTNCIEKAYLWLLCMLRFCINLYANTPALLSSVSISILAYGLIYLGAKLVRDIIIRRNEV